VPACIHVRPGLSNFGHSIICSSFSHTTLLQLILSQSWVETSESLGRISSSELDLQPWHFTNNRLSFPPPDNSLGCTLYPPSTPHFTRTAHLPHPLPKRTRFWDVHWHRTDWRLLGYTHRERLSEERDSLFKRSSLRYESHRDIMIVFMTFRNITTVSTWKVCLAGVPKLCNSDDASMRDPHCGIMLSGRTSYNCVESISFFVPN